MYRITSMFGDFEKIRKSPHNGIDFAMPTGEPLRAVVEGKIRIADYGSGLSGKTVYIDTIDGKTFVYGHLSEFSVNAGDIVHAGDLVGLAGSTGFSTGSHLHFAIKEGGEFIDPTPYIDTIQNMNTLAIEKATEITFTVSEFFKSFDLPIDLPLELLNNLKLNFIHSISHLGTILTDHISFIQIIENIFKFFL